MQIEKNIQIYSQAFLSHVDNKLSSETPAFSYKEVQEVIEQGKPLCAGFSEALDKSFGKPQNDEPYLFSIDSNLVTTGWNRNDDIFIPKEVWNARKTANDKPIDWQHEAEKIVGHMKNSVVLDDKFGIVDDSTDIEDLPKTFHVGTRGVLYGMRFPEAVKEIIKKASENSLFVSMECWFDKFDYMINGAVVVERTEETAFLDKYLKRYGGDGTYRGKQIGRVLRGVVFDGKGLVDNPANPYSIIYSVGASSKETDPVIFKIDEIASFCKILDRNELRDRKVFYFTKGGERIMTDKEMQDLIANLKKESEGFEATLKAAKEAADKLYQDKTKEVEVLTAERDSLIEKIKTIEADVVAKTKDIDDRGKLIAQKDEEINGLKKLIADAERVKIGEARFTEIRSILGDKVEKEEDEKKRLSELEEVAYLQEKVEAFKLYSESLKNTKKDGDPPVITKPEKAANAALLAGGGDPKDLKNVFGKALSVLSGDKS